VNQLGLVATFQVMEDRSIIEIGQIDHVIALLKLRWVDLANLIGLEGFFLEKMLMQICYLLETSKTIINLNN
jgi:hypothetical protein